VHDNQITVEVDGDRAAPGYKKFRLVFLPLYLTIMAALYIAMTVVIATYTIESALGSETIYVKILCACVVQTRGGFAPVPVEMLLLCN
jgi:hypothetical protein